MLKRILRNWYRYVVWALLSGVLWAWIFSLVTEKPAEQKVVLFADIPGMESAPLERALEEGKPEGIAYVQASLFSYALINQTEVLHGDLYLVPESKVEEYLASFAPIDTALFPNETYYEADGAAYGILVCDAEAGFGVGWEYIYYSAEERTYLFFNQESPHLGAWNGSADDAALTVAQCFLKLKRRID